MASSIAGSLATAAWALVRLQHGVVAGWQLRALGYSQAAIKHRVASGRLHRIWRDVYAVGRPDLPDRGRWMAAALACGSDAAVSHESAGALFGIVRGGFAPIDVSVPDHRHRHRGIRVHQRTPMPPITAIDGIPTTTALTTIVDLAAHLSTEPLTKAINEADRLGLIDHDELVALVESLSGRRGIRKLRAMLGIYTRTDSNLERRFLALVDRANLPRPETQVELLGFRVDFAWPEIGLVVETDGLTYHRTPSQQAADRKRDQVLMAAGFTCLRFTNAQIRSEPGDVIATLRSVYDSSVRNASSSMISVPTFSAFASFEPGSAPSSR